MADLFSQFQNNTLVTPTVPGVTAATALPTPTTVSPPNSTTPFPTGTVDTSSFTPAQMSAYNYAASLAVKPPVVSVSGLQSPQAPINVPPAPTQNYSAPVVNGGAMVDANNKTLTPPADSTNSSDILSALKDAFPTPPSAADQYNTDYANSGIAGLLATNNANNQAVLDAKGKLDAVNAKLAGINAEADANKISQEDRLVPTFAIGGAQAQIERERAIRALPLQAEALSAQAEVAAAQGNAQLSQSILQQAQDHLDKIYSIHQTDANNTYSYRTNLIDKAFSLATTAQQNQLSELKATLATNHSDVTNSINQAQQLSVLATQNGQGDIAARLAGLVPPDINSKTFATDLQKYNAQVALLQGKIVPKASQPTEATIKTQQDARASSALSDAESAIKQGADPEVVRKAYLVKYPSYSDLWTNYFTPSAGDNAPSSATKGTPTYPTTTPTSKPFNLFDPSTW